MAHPPNLDDGCGSANRCSVGQ